MGGTRDDILAMWVRFFDITHKQTTITFNSSARCYVCANMTGDLLP